MSSDDEEKLVSEGGSGEPTENDCSPTPPDLDLSSQRPGHNQPTAEDMALYRAVEFQDIAAIENLLKDGASPAALDDNGLTPLHLCIVKKYIEPFITLLKHEGSADVLDASGLSVLYVAILHIWRQGVNAAIAAGVRVAVEELPFIPEAVVMQRYPQAMLSKFGSKFYEDTLMHLAAKCGDVAIIDEIAAAIKLNNNAGVDCLNKMGVTALYTAIECGDLEAVKVLVKRGASVNKVSRQNDTALHTAVYHPHIVKYILEETNVEIRNNDRGSAPIHLAVAINNYESVRLLLDVKHMEPWPFLDSDSSRVKNCSVKDPEDVQLTSVELSPWKFRYPFLRVKTLTQIISLDGGGYTPLHIAAQQRNMSMITLLLRKGAKLSTKGGKGKTALEIIATEFYNPSKCFELIFDEFINTEQVVSDSLVKVEYDALTVTQGVSQLEVIEELVRCGQSKTLIHPLIESLLYLKWEHLLPAFYAMIGIYTTFLISFNLFVVKIIHYRDKNNGSFNASVPSTSETTWFDLFNGWYWLLIALIYVSMALLLLQELFYIYLRRFRYFLTLETWVKLACLVLGAIVPVAESFTVQPYWHRHAASAALLLTWLQTMFLVSRFPKLGYYVLVFGKVTINIFKILVTSICLIIGFSFCFMIEFQWAPPFDDPFAAFVKTVVMMSSEFDYEDLFHNKNADNLQETKTVIRLVFVVFVVFVAIILMNFMIGVAVSDINDLQLAGCIKRLEKQVELLRSLEVLVNNRLLANLYTKRFGDKKYHMKISNYVGLRSKWCAALSADYDFYYLDIPSALHAGIIDIAWRKEQRDEKNSIVMKNNYKLNALYDAVVDRPLITDEVFNEDKDSTEKKISEKQSRINMEIKLLKDGLSVVSNDVKKAMAKVNQISSDITTVKDMLTSLAYAISSEHLHLTVPIAMQCSEFGPRKGSV